jgi:hypothetical protein
MVLTFQGSAGKTDGSLGSNQQASSLGSLGAKSGDPNSFENEVNLGGLGHHSAHVLTHLRDDEVERLKKEEDIVRTTKDLDSTYSLHLFCKLYQYLIRGHYSYKRSANVREM